jgi:hypothetical protein
MLAQSYEWLSVLLAVTLVWTWGCTVAGAQAAGDKSGRGAKVAPELTALHDEFASYLASDRARPFRPGNPLVRVIEDRVVIDAVASGEASALQADLVALGMRGAAAFGRVVSGELPISSIPAMAELLSLNSARAATGIVHGAKSPPSPGTPKR